MNSAAFLALRLQKSNQSFNERERQKERERARGKMEGGRRQCKIKRFYESIKYEYYYNSSKNFLISSKNIFEYEAIIR